MAIYQYYLAVIPKQAVEKKHLYAPNKIRVSTETGYFESDAEVYWKMVKIRAEEIVAELDDLLVERAEWGNDKISLNWKTYTEKSDNDASIYLDEKTLTIREFYFRADLREEGLVFLKNMIKLGREREWLFMDKTGKIIQPYFEDIVDSIKESNAFKFVTEPIKFLKNELDKE